MSGKTERLMALSGFLGLSFWVAVNFSNLFASLNVLAGLIQILLNIFVFFSWRRGYQEKHGFKKFVAACGVVVPVIMAGITLVRVILPSLN